MVGDGTLAVGSGLVQGTKAVGSGLAEGTKALGSGLAALGDNTTRSFQLVADGVGEAASPVAKFAENIGFAELANNTSKGWKKIGDSIAVQGDRALVSQTRNVLRVVGRNINASMHDKAMPTKLTKARPSPRTTHQGMAQGGRGCMVQGG